LLEGITHPIERWLSWLFAEGVRLSLPVVVILDAHGLALTV